MDRKGLTQEQFEELQRASREELLDVLSDFVRKKRGRPRSEQPLTGAERTRRWRERRTAEGESPGNTNTETAPTAVE